MKGPWLTNIGTLDSHQQPVGMTETRHRASSLPRRGESSFAHPHHAHHRKGKKHPQLFRPSFPESVIPDIGHRGSRAWTPKATCMDERSHCPKSQGISRCPLRNPPIIQPVGPIDMIVANEHRRPGFPITTVGNDEGKTPSFFHSSPSPASPFSLLPILFRHPRHWSSGIHPKQTSNRSLCWLSGKRRPSERPLLPEPVILDDLINSPLTHVVIFDNINS